MTTEKTEVLSSSIKAKGLLLGMDLFFVSKVQGTAQLLGAKLEAVASISQLEGKFSSGDYQFLLIDLEAYTGGLEFLSGVKQSHPQLKILGFGSHVNTSRLNAAEAGGAHQVMPRSKFTLQLPAILTELIGQ